MKREFSKRIASDTRHAQGKEFERDNLTHGQDSQRTRIDMPGVGIYNCGLCLSGAGPFHGASGITISCLFFTSWCSLYMLRFYTWVVYKP